MLILGIDTSGKTASAAICSENSVIAEKTIATKLTHSQIILPMAEELLKDEGLTFNDLTALAAVKGPGSYTGLRIGLSTIKGIAFAAGCKCAGISALSALAYNFRGMCVSDFIVFPVMFARQDLIYNAVFKVEGGKVLRCCEDRLIPADQAVREIAGSTLPVYIAGDHTEKICELCSQNGMKNIYPAPPQLVGMKASSLCFAAFEQGFVSPENLAPDYLEVTRAEKELNTGHE